MPWVIPCRSLVFGSLLSPFCSCYNLQASLDYSRVAARVFSAYSNRVKQLVHQQPGHASRMDHHSVAELIHNALRYVSTEYRAVAALRS